MGTGPLPRNVGQSNCRDCGEALIWAWREDGSRHPPLERVFPAEKFVYLDEHGVVHPVAGSFYIKHNCEPVDIDLP